ncbi:MAG: 4'-phosphopantetheinyl transferase superfamily protein [Gammaproteobacteria bacterium]|nr:4'-phosphopantetheinyl transferase superfamily protein [Gammaproteobacteria bacterium]
MTFRELKRSSQVLLYLIHFPDALPKLADCIKTLDSEETARMQRFYSEKLQQHFALTRGSLRQILGQHLNLDPADIRFEYSEQGKPFLKNHALQFNLAHSGDYCVIALCLQDCIGVDIERCSHAHKPYYGIAKRFFTRQEFLALAHCSIHEGEDLFYHLWTQKEAFLKAIGQGIAFGLDHFEVSTDKSKAFVCNIQDPLFASKTWSSQSFTQPDGYRIVVTKENAMDQIDWA